MRQHRRFWLLAGGVLLLAAVFRLVNLSSWPPGLHYDEAVVGIDALDIIDGARPLYLTRNNGREPLHAYAVALSVAALGRTPAAVRLPAALASLFTVLGVMLGGRALFSPRVGLLAGLVAASSVWSIMLGRLGTRPAWLPMLLSFAVWAGVRGFQRQHTGWWLLSGALFGLAAYSYSSIRVIWLALVVWAVALVLLGEWRRLWPGAAWFALSAALVALPLALVALSDPALVFGRTGAVSIVSPDYGLRDNIVNVLRQTYIVLRMFVVPGGGDPNLRHNIAGRPVFDALMALPFVAGLGLTVLRRKWRVTLWLAGLWVLVGLLPSILSREIPHFLRASAALPLLFVFPAVGLDWLAEALRGRAGQLASGLVAGALLAGSVAITASDYLLPPYLTREDVQAWFEIGPSELAARINTLSGSGWGASEGEPAGHLLVDEALDLSYPPITFLAPAAESLPRFSPNALPALAGRTATLIVAGGDAGDLLAALPDRCEAHVETGPPTPASAIHDSAVLYSVVTVTCE